MFVLYPAELETVKQLLNVLGEPRKVELSVLVKDIRLGEVLGTEGQEDFTVNYTCKPHSEKIIKLYNKYYEGYVKGINLSEQIKEEPIPILSFKAYWYDNGLSVEFNSFKLRITGKADVNKIVQLLKKFEGKRINIEIDLSRSRL